MRGGDKVFRERYHTTTGFFLDTDTDNYFPNDNYFPDINNLFNDMASEDLNGSSSNTQYVIICFGFNIMIKKIFLAICLQLLFPHSLFDFMTRLIYAFLIMYYY